MTELTEMLNNYLAVTGATGAILLGFVALYLLTRLPWWLWKGCILGLETTLAIQEQGPPQRAKGRGWMASFPPSVSTWGFACALLWPAAVGLNLLLLAQVMELVVPGGERVTILMFGSYTALSLLLGALFAVSQTVFSVAAGHVQRRLLAVVFVVLTALTILVEMGLAGMRAWYLIAGEEAVAPTLADQALMSRSVALSMFLALVVPLAHILLGFVAVPRFLIPIVGYVPRFVGGLLLWAWWALLEFFCGFQPVQIVPDVVAGLKRSAEKLGANLVAILWDVRETENVAAGLSRVQKPLSEIRSEIDSLAILPAVEHESWNDERKQGQQALAAATTAAECEEIARDLRSYLVRLEGRTRAMYRESKAWEQRLGQLPRATADWTGQHQHLEKSLVRLRKSITESQSATAELGATQARLHGILKPAGSTVSEYTDPLEKELDDLRRAGLNPATERERRRANRRYATCVRLVDEKAKEDLAQASTSLVSLDARVAKLETLRDGISAPPPPPSSVDLAKALAVLRNARREMIRTKTVVSKSCREFLREVEYAGRALRRGKPIHPERKQGPIGRFFSWLGGIFSEFIEAVMRANQPSEPGNSRLPAKAGSAGAEFDSMPEENHGRRPSHSSRER